MNFIVCNLIIAKILRVGGPIGFSKGLGGIGESVLESLERRRRVNHAFVGPSIFFAAKTGHEGFEFFRLRIRRGVSKA